MIIASVGNVSKVTQEVIAWSRQGTEKHSIVYKQQLLSINIYSSHEGRDIGRMRSLGIMKFSRSRVPGTLKGIYEPCKQTSSHCFSLPFTTAVQVILMPLAFSLEPLKTSQTQQSQTRQHFRPPSRDAERSWRLALRQFAWQTVKNPPAEYWNIRHSYNLKFK